MSTYPRWESDFLSVESFPDTKRNRLFLSDWNLKAESDCDHNPVDLTYPVAGSHKCQDSNFPGRPFRKYDDPGATLTAWTTQIESGNYPNLRAAFQSGDPYSASDPGAVAGELGHWGSSAFANSYIVETSSGGPGHDPGHDAHTHEGWKDLQHSFNHQLPHALKTSDRARKHALHELSRASKVKL